MATLYVTEHGVRLEKEHRSILVSKNHQIILAVPIFKLKEVVLVGSIGVTTQALMMLLDEGVNLSFITRSGTLRGRLRVFESVNTNLIRKQYVICADKERQLEISRRFVFGKLHNCRIMALRMIRKNKDNEIVLQKMKSALGHLTRAIRQLDECADMQGLLGFEGLGTRSYFSIFRLSLNSPDIRDFTKRQRRPPKDPVNSLLSFGYTLLANSLVTACEISGLNPFIGFFHTESYGKPALALDLMEEFRPVIVDSIVLRLINEKRLKLNNFYFTDQGKCMLTRKGLRIFLAAYNRRLHDRLFTQIAGRPETYQHLFEIQARQIRHIIESKISKYEAVKVK